MEIQQDHPPLSSLLPPPPCQLSFAYNHVKQLNTSKPKQTTLNTKVPSCADGDGHASPNQNLKKHDEQQQLRKQARRRLHTNRPYQERFLNMAEARKEIVTALKYHRATMKQASEQQQQLQCHQQHQSLSFQPSLLSRFSPDGRFKSRRRPRMYPPSSTKISNYLNDFSFSSSFPSLPPLPLPPPPVPNSYPNAINSPFGHPTPKAETPNFTLPSQTMGLNINLHHFNSLEPTLLLDNNSLDPALVLNNSNIIDPTFFLNNNNNSSLCSYWSPTFSSPPLLTDEDVPSIGISQSQGEGGSPVMNTIESTATQASGSLHVAMDDEGMAEIRALGEQHQMEWDDTMSLVSSVWWFDCLQQMEHNAHEVNTEDDTCHEIFDELDFPIWEN